MSKWIKTSEKLPKEGESVLVWNNIHWNYEFSQPFISRWRTFGKSMSWQGCNPTHWMPLPKPPRKIKK